MAGSFSRALSCALLLVVLAACGQGSTSAPTDQAQPPTSAPPSEAVVAPSEATPSEAVADATPSDQVTFTEASGVTVAYEDGYKLVEVIPPDIPDAEPLRYILIEPGATPPDVDGQVIEVPVETVVSLTTSNLPHFDTLGAVDRLVGVGTAAFVTTQSVLDAAAAGEITDFAGPEGEPDLERLIATDPDLLIVDGFGSAILDDVGRFTEAGVPTVINADFNEQTLLGRAEWLKFTSLFLDAEAEANAAYDEVVAAYQEVVERAAATEGRPTVFANTPFEGTWFMPAGGNSFAAAVEQAGGTYVFADQQGTRNVQLDIETVLAEAGDADVWLQAGSVSGTLADLLAIDERFAEFEAFQTGQVWAYDKAISPGGGNAIFETAYARPDLYLADIAAILHPEAFSDHELVFYGQVPAEQ